jgi:hypothetical protein
MQPVFCEHCGAVEGRPHRKDCVVTRRKNRIHDIQFAIVAIAISAFVIAHLGWVAILILAVVAGAACVGDDAAPLK